MQVTIYTDGACSYNPGPGGYGVVLIADGVEKELSGYEANTTNNRMEITAVIKGLEALKYSCSVTIYSDSAYVVNAVNLHWLEKWQKSNWKKGKEDVKNIDLWKQLLELLEKHTVSFVKVKGHANNEYNNRCDELATTQVAMNK